MYIVSTDDDGIDLGRERPVFPEDGAIETSDLAGSALCDAGRAREATAEEVEALESDDAPAESGEAPEEPIDVAEEALEDAGLETEQVEPSPGGDGSEASAGELPPGQKREHLESFDYNAELKPAYSDLLDVTGDDHEDAAGSWATDELIEYMIAHWSEADEAGLLNP